MEQAEKTVKNYEIGFLVRTENDRQDLTRILENQQMSIINDGQISRVKLAYPIKKEGFAYFGYFYFSGDPQNIKKLEYELRTSPKILRFLIISNPILKTSKFVDEQTKPVKERYRIQEASFVNGAEDKEKPKPAKKTEALSNEALEKKLEEILK